MITQKQALYALSQHYDLSLLYELEPDRIEFLLGLASECIKFGESKASALAGLEMYATRLVGSNALHPLLRTAKYEEALLAFIDWLLPDDEREMENAE